MDSLLVAAPAISDSMTNLFITLLPYTSPVTLLVGLTIFYFRNEVKVWLTQRTFDRTSLVNDVKAISEHLEQHTKDEEEFWKESDEKLKFQEGRIMKLELAQVEIRTLLESQHSEILRNMAEQNKRIDDIMKFLMRVNTVRKDTL